MSIKNRLLRILRGYLWKLLGFGYNHIQRSVDLPFLKNDTNAAIGFGTYDNNALVYRWSDAPLVIGKYCSISYGVKFIMDDGSHLYNKISNYPFRANKVTSGGGIKIGNDVWICMDVIILNGVTIGDGAIIAAGSVVTNDVEPYTVVGGIPAKTIKEKCTREESKAMQNIAWWDWDKLEIENKRTDFQLSYNEFIIKYNKTKN